VREGAPGSWSGSFPGPGSVPGGDPIRVLIVDDHPVVRDGLRGILDGSPGFEVVGEGGAKLNVNDRAAAVAAGFERGLLPRATE
jgi:hypothetical protein